MRQPPLSQPITPIAATTTSHGSHTRNSRNGSIMLVTRKSLIACVPPMTGTPLRRLSPTHSTMRSTAGLMSTTSASGNDVTPASARDGSDVPSTTRGEHGEPRQGARDQRAR